MGKIIAAINMTLDGVCDHTAGLPDEDIHDHYTNLLKSGDAIIYGRKTFELMEFWRQYLENPSGERTMDDFANAIDRIPKIVFSNTINETSWNTATVAVKSLEETAKEFREMPGRTLLVGSRSLISQLLRSGMLDELQLLIYPLIEGKGKPLFTDHEQTLLRLTGTKVFKNGSIILNYHPLNRINEKI